MPQSSLPTVQRESEQANKGERTRERGRWSGRDGRERKGKI